MSSSTADQTPPEKTEKKAGLDKKKLKVLKQALKEERQSKALVEKELEAAANRLELQKKEMNDRVKTNTSNHVYRMLSTNNSTRRISICRKPWLESLND
jgi:hypothetical protein